MYGSPGAVCHLTPELTAYYVVSYNLIKNNYEIGVLGDNFIDVFYS